MLCCFAQLTTAQSSARSDTGDVCDEGGQHRLRMHRCTRDEPPQEGELRAARGARRRRLNVEGRARARPCPAALAGRVSLHGRAASPPDDGARRGSGRRTADGAVPSDGSPAALVGDRPRGRRPRGAAAAGRRVDEEGGAAARAGGGGRGWRGSAPTSRARAASRAAAPTACATYGSRARPAHSWRSDARGVGGRHGVEGGRQPVDVAADVRGQVVLQQGVVARLGVARPLGGAAAAQQQAARGLEAVARRRARGADARAAELARAASSRRRTGGGRRRRGARARRRRRRAARRAGARRPPPASGAPPALVAPLEPLPRQTTLEGASSGARRRSACRHPSAGSAAGRLHDEGAARGPRPRARRARGPPSGRLRREAARSRRGGPRGARRGDPLAALWRTRARARPGRARSRRRRRRGRRRRSRPTRRGCARPTGRTRRAPGGERPVARAGCTCARARRHALVAQPRERVRERPQRAPRGEGGAGAAGEGRGRRGRRSQGPRKARALRGGRRAGRRRCGVVPEPLGRRRRGAGRGRARRRRRGSADEPQPRAAHRRRASFGRATQGRDLFFVERRAPGPAAPRAPYRTRASPTASARPPRRDGHARRRAASSAPPTDVPCAPRPRRRRPSALLSSTQNDIQEQALGGQRAQPPLGREDHPRVHDRREDRPPRRRRHAGAAAPARRRDPLRGGDARPDAHLHAFSRFSAHGTYSRSTSTSTSRCPPRRSRRRTVERLAAILCREAAADDPNADSARPDEPLRRLRALGPPHARRRRAPQARPPPALAGGHRGGRPRRARSWRA